ncbi:unnamed protein product, partial [Allacma fusca]
ADLQLILKWALERTQSMEINLETLGTGKVHQILRILATVIT